MHLVGQSQTEAALHLHSAAAAHFLLFTHYCLRSWEDWKAKQAEEERKAAAAAEEQEQAMRECLAHTLYCPGGLRLCTLCSEGA